MNSAVAFGSRINAIAARRTSVVPIRAEFGHSDGRVSFRVFLIRRPFELVLEEERTASARARRSREFRCSDPRQSRTATHREKADRTSVPREDEGRDAWSRPSAARCGKSCAEGESEKGARGTPPLVRGRTPRSLRWNSDYVRSLVLAFVCREEKGEARDIRALEAAPTRVREFERLETTLQIPDSCLTHRRRERSEAPQPASRGRPGTGPRSSSTRSSLAAA